MKKGVIRLLGVPTASVAMVGAVDAAALVSAPPASAATVGSPKCPASVSKPLCSTSISAGALHVLTAGVHASTGGGGSVTASVRTSGLAASAHAAPAAVSIAAGPPTGNPGAGGGRGGGGSGGGSGGTSGRHHGSGSGTGDTSAGAPDAVAAPSAAVPMGVPNWFLALVSGDPARGSGNVTPQLPSIPARGGKPQAARTAADPLSPQVAGTQLLGLAALWAAIGTVLATLWRRRPQPAGPVATADGSAETARDGRGSARPG